ncbi:MAG: hypothetical protein EA349_13130 [Halomonadaceae bacterium]|nr:MAG: hypothetical protein EA349_13130 [Halomonadaceae bacterium]
MKTSTRSLAILIVLLFLLTACSGNNGPDVSKAFTQYLQENLPPWEARQFKVIARENVGTEAQPVYQVRYEATIYPAEHLYQQRASLLSSPVLEQVQKKNQRFNVHGIGELVLYGGDWHSDFYMESGYPDDGGRPASAFQGNHVVMGTSAYRNLIKRAKDNGESLSQEISQQQQAVREAQAALEQLRKDHTRALSESSATLASIQQANREQRQQLNAQHRQGLQKSNVELRAERSQQEAALRETHQQRIGEIEAAYSDQVEANRKERASAQQQRSQRLNQARDQHQADIRDARSRLERDAFRAFNSEAQTRLQNQRQTIETHYRDQLAPISEKEAAAREQRREALQVATQHYREQLAALSEESTQANRATQKEARNVFQGALSEIDTELQNAEQTHRALQAKGNENITQARNDLQRLQQALNSKQSQLQRIEQQLAELER